MTGSSPTGVVLDELLQVLRKASQLVQDIHTQAIHTQPLHRLGGMWLHVGSYAWARQTLVKIGLHRCWASWTLPGVWLRCMLWLWTNECADRVSREICRCQPVLWVPHACFISCGGLARSLSYFCGISALPNALAYSTTPGSSHVDTPSTEGTVCFSARAPSAAAQPRATPQLLRSQQWSSFLQQTFLPGMH